VGGGRPKSDTDLYDEDAEDGDAAVVEDVCRLDEIFHLLLVVVVMMMLHVVAGDVIR